MMHNIPQDCINNPFAPWQEKVTPCPTCGSNMYVSSFNEDMLECESDSCDTTVDLRIEEY